MTGSLTATTRTDVGMYAYQTLNQNNVERRSSLKIPQMKELTFLVFIAKKAFKDENEVMTARLSKREIGTSVPDGLTRLLTIWSELFIENSVKMILKYICVCPTVLVKVRSSLYTS
jgi:hypothetical protein